MEKKHKMKYITPTINGVGGLQVKSPSWLQLNRMNDHALKQTFPLPLN